MKNVKIGIVGLGNIVNFHLKGIKKLKKYLKIIGVCDIDERKGKEFLKKFKAEYFKNVDDLLKNTQIDAVMITVPTFLHYPVALKCIEKNKHIFCEKPMTTSSKNSLDIYKKAEGKNIIFQIGYMRRFNPAFLKFKELVGKIEKIYSVNVSLFTYSSIYNINNFKEISWTLNPEKSGGYFLPHSGSHLIDIIRFIFGEPLSVNSKIYFLKENLDVSTNAFFDMGEYFLNFKISILSNPKSILSKTYWEEKFEVIGRNGRIILENYTWTGNKKVFLKWMIDKETKEERIYVFNQWENQMNQFIRSILNNKISEPNAYDGYRVDLIMDKMRESNKKGKSVLIK